MNVLVSFGHTVPKTHQNKRVMNFMNLLLAVNPDIDTPGNGTLAIILLILLILIFSPKNKVEENKVEENKK